MENNDLGTKIKKLRKITGMNRKDFCKYFGIPYQTVTDWERNQRHSPDYFVRLLSYFILFENWSTKKNSSNTNNINSNSNKTIDDYLALPDDVRAELIDGVLYDMATPSTYHQIIAGSIYTQLSNHIKSHNGACLPFIAPTDVQLDCDNKTMVQPDVFVICDPSKLTKARIYGAPDFVVEVLSQSDWHRDIVLKLRKYRLAGVREYWIVMPENRKVLVYFFEESPYSEEFTFEDDIPVNIWKGECKINLSDVNKLLEELGF